MILTTSFPGSLIRRKVFLKFRTFYEMFPGGIGVSLPCDGKDIEPAIQDEIQSLFLAYNSLRKQPSFFAPGPSGVSRRTAVFAGYAYKEACEMVTEISS